MNLQVNSPYTKCPYRCPYCVAGVTADYPFSDKCYKEYPWMYFTLLERAISRYGITTVVLTGSTEPTLFPDWIEEVCAVLRHCNGVSAELQTKNYKWTETFGVIDTIAYSHDCIPTHERPAHDTAFIRDVFLWNKALTSKMILDYFLNQRNVDQCTVKQLVPSSYGIQSIDDYIKSIYKRLTFTDQLILKDNHVWIDEDCAASKDRYLIYRTDGFVYEKWSDTQPIG